MPISASTSTRTSTRTRTRSTRSSRSTEHGRTKHSASEASTPTTSTSGSVQPRSARQPRRNGNGNANDNDNDNRKHTRGSGYGDGPTFEIIVLGSGGGPLETDCSGYLVKATKSSWEDGVLALEGGSGLGALASILSTKPAASLFPSLEIPSTHNTPLLQAAYVFSFLACYLITHAHMDHVGSLVMLSGSVPPRTRTIEHAQAPCTFPRRPSGTSPPPAVPTPAPAHPRPHVYGTRSTLEQLSQAYMGGLWPELGSWVPDREGDQYPSDNGKGSGTKRKRRADHGATKIKVNGADGSVTPSEENYSSCLLFSPLSTERVHRPLHPPLPITLLTYPVSHGCTSRDTYESSAMFIRYDPGALSHPPTSSSLTTSASTPTSTSTSRGSEGDAGREFLFFGDVESAYRRPGEEDVDADRAKEADRMNGAIWREASKSWRDGRLCGIFIECSYDSARPAHLMFGHLSPPALYYELGRLAALVSQDDERLPLAGLKIFIIHIKDALVPHPTGRTAREIIMAELWALEEAGALGVEFVETKRGDRIEI